MSTCIEAAHGDKKREYFRLQLELSAGTPTRSHKLARAHACTVPARVCPRQPAAAWQQTATSFGSNSAGTLGKLGTATNCKLATFLQDGKGVAKCKRSSLSSVYLSRLDKHIHGSS